MGSRANHVLVKDGQWHLYGGRGAIDLPWAWFWGPDEAVALIESQEAIPRAHWLDDVWCEGAALVDLDRRVLLLFDRNVFYGDVALRRAYLMLLAHTWPGWTLRWVPRFLDLATYVGDQNVRLVCALSADVALLNTADAPSESTAFFTFARDGVTTACLADCEGPDVLGRGPSILRELQGFPEYAGTWPGAGAPWLGAHIDENARSLEYWSATLDDAARVTAFIAAAWPGWHVVFLGDDVAVHEARSGGVVRVPPPDVPALQRMLLTRLAERATIVSASRRAALARLRDALDTPEPRG